MKDDLRLHNVFEYRTGFNPIYQIQIRGKSIFGEGWSEHWQTKEQFLTIQDCLDDIATYHPKWFENNQVRITELKTTIEVKATEPLPKSYGRHLTKEATDEN